MLSALAVDWHGSAYTRNDPWASSLCMLKHSTGGPGCEDTSGLCSRSAQLRGRSSSRPAMLKGRKEEGGLQNCSWLMPTQCQWVPEETALALLEDQPCTHSCVWAGEQRHQAAMLPLYFFPQILSKSMDYTGSAAISVSHKRVGYQTASVRT